MTRREFKPTPPNHRLRLLCVLVHSTKYSRWASDDLKEATPEGEDASWLIEIVPNEDGNLTLSKNVIKVPMTFIDSSFDVWSVVWLNGRYILEALQPVSITNQFPGGHLALEGLVDESQLTLIDYFESLLT